MSQEDLLVYEDFKILSSLRILIVEDIPINQEIILYHFGRIGIQADCANNGLTAIEMVKQKLLRCSFA